MFAQALSWTVRLAGSTPLRVIHGPLGTGESQTLANLVGDQRDLYMGIGRQVFFLPDRLLVPALAENG